MFNKILIHYRLLKDIYNLRSRIVHQGKKIGYEKNCGITISNSPSGVDEKRYMSILNMICNRLLINWLQKSKDSEYQITNITTEILMREYYNEAIHLQETSWSLVI